MAWIYAFAERNETRYTKLGLAKGHYLERFEKTQQCNPIPMEIAATWQFPTPTAAKACEGEIRKGIIFPRVAGGGAEWFQVSSSDILTDKAFGRIVAGLDGISLSPESASGKFFETLKIGSRDKNGSLYRPHLYLISEEPSTGACKLVLTCYNWPTVLAHYMTYNPRALSVTARWSFADEIAGTEFVEKLKRRLLSREVNPLGWFRIKPEELIAIVSEMGATPFPRTSQIDDRVHYTKHRIPVG